MRQTQQEQGAVLRSPMKGSGVVHRETARPRSVRFLTIPHPLSTQSPPMSSCWLQQISGLQSQFDASWLPSAD